MIKAERADRALVVLLLVDSFENNQSVNYIVRNDERWLKRIRALMEYSFDLCYLFGEVWLSADKQACALFLYPHLKKTTLRALWLDARLIFQAIGPERVGVALAREAKIKKLQSTEDMIYLWFIGVSPVHQHRGTGSALLKEILIYADKQGLPVCLETSTIKNISWYEQFGFVVYGQLDLGYTLFFLKREIGK